MLRLRERSALSPLVEHFHRVHANRPARREEYGRERLRRHNRCLHGYGVACGLEVSCDGTTVHVGAGLATVLGNTQILFVVVLAWLFVCALVSLPYVRASTGPPPGRVFVGFFHYVDDAYNYLSFVQQAEDGAFLLRNKDLSPPRPARLGPVRMTLDEAVAAVEATLDSAHLRVDRRRAREDATSYLLLVLDSSGGRRDDGPVGRRLAVALVADATRPGIGGRRIEDGQVRGEGVAGEEVAHLGVGRLRRAGQERGSQKHEKSAAEHGPVLSPRCRRGKPALMSISRPQTPKGER